MSKPFTEAQLSDQLAGELGWRLKEVSDLKAAIRSADAPLRRVLLRALVTICYAHWEGYVRFSARKFLEHISLRKFTYDQLDRQFLRNYFLPRLAALSNSKTSLLERCNLVDDVLQSGDKRFSKINDELVNTKSNLNSEVCSDICLICGIGSQSFRDKSTFIDVVLLKRRNAIAHGEETFVSFDDLDALVDETIGLMRAFKDALENHVYLNGYRAA